tara:strand:+ start:2128 stop:3075 length:948 start_codon:yes stop_codon:yes gene_type:complete
VKILITGSSGFIGYHLADLLSKKNKVLGIDNHNNYYSENIKKKRLFLLKKNKNFTFKKINLNNKNSLEEIFKKFKPEVVYHCAGQPGVIYSLKNPKIYKINNIIVTKIICDLSKKYNIKKFLFASSSSVYGDQKKFPIRETFKLNPKNPYAKTKLRSEKIIISTFNNSKIAFAIFRFFTVYGPFGRPDMFIHKFLNSLKNRKSIKLHNKGLNYRDFTYVGDVVKILHKSLYKKIDKKILNICRSKPIITTKLVKLILKFYKTKKVKIKETKFIKGEMLKTHGSNNKLKKIFGNIVFTDIEKGLKKTINNYKLFNM